MKIKGSLKITKLYMIETLIIGVAVVILTNLILIQPNRIEGESMVPTLRSHEYIFTEKISYRFRSPLRGDIVVFKSPHEKTKELVKRLIALPNEKVRIKKGKITIYNHANKKGFELTEAYLPAGATTNGDRTIVEDQLYELKDGQYLVMGDNRPKSSDSRVFGPIKKGNIVGQAWIRYWPLSKLTFLSGRL